MEVVRHIVQSWRVDMDNRLFTIVCRCGWSVSGLPLTMCIEDYVDHRFEKWVKND